MREQRVTVTLSIPSPTPRKLGARNSVCVHVVWPYKVVTLIFCHTAKSAVGGHFVGVAAADVVVEGNYIAGVISQNVF